LNQVKSDIRNFKTGIRFSVIFISILWAIKLIEAVLGEFTFLGIYPRTLEGSVGILTGPLVHGDIFHLLSNTIPVFILITGLFYFYRRVAVPVFFLIYVMTGFWVWIAAREAFHIGASGVVYGLISFLMFSGFFRKDIRSLAVSFIMMILYGGNMIYGIIPGNLEVSWESHLLGFLSGLFCAVYFRSSDMVKTKAQLYKDEEEKSFVTRNYFTFNDTVNVSYKPKKEPIGKIYTYTLPDQSKDE